MHVRRSLHQTETFDCYVCINGIMKMVDNTFFSNDKSKKALHFPVRSPSKMRGCFLSDRSLDTSVLSPKVTSR